MPLVVYGADPVSFQRRWLSWEVWGLGLILLGVAVLAWPGLSLRVLVSLLSLLALAGGVLLTISGTAVSRFSAGRWSRLAILPGIALVVLAVVALLYPRAVSQLFVMLFAALAVTWGVVDVGLAFGSRRFFAGWWMRALRGVLVVVAGLAVVVYPVAGLIAAAWLIGAWALLVGVVSIAIGLWIKATPVS